MNAPDLIFDLIVDGKEYSLMQFIPDSGLVVRDAELFLDPCKGVVRKTFGEEVEEIQVYLPEGVRHGRALVPCQIPDVREVFLPDVDLAEKAEWLPAHSPKIEDYAWGCLVRDSLGREFLIGDEAKTLCCAVPLTEKPIVEYAVLVVRGE